MVWRIFSRMIDTVIGRNNLDDLVHVIMVPYSESIYEEVYDGASANDTSCCSFNIMEKGVVFLELIPFRLTVRMDASMLYSRITIPFNIIVLPLNVYIRVLLIGKVSRPNIETGLTIYRIILLHLKTA